ncbi:LOW QUALITY PROTEIN: Helitron helicase-like protein [Phytophthora palmivora]|uniref:ATP-dependent DNA helicase n=1 Tax=Phytophthora palmivora TaxID=4796 RepID=A0A2P4Y4E4_9STRA|nr:LOW QUALITY PROTEIN: Helitron helicase-like protein [Phytophthora palmivora]
MKRDWNQSADSLASAALRRESEVVIVKDEEHQDLMTLNRLDELLIAKNDGATLNITAVTRSRKKCRPQVLQKEIAYLRGDVQGLTSDETKSCRYETDESGLLFYFPSTKQSDEDRDLMAKLVVPETLQNDLMHHYHSSLEGDHQGIGRTYHKIRAHSTGADYIRVYNATWVNCETGKGRPTIHGESPCNLQATYPFQIIGMGHIPSLPRSYRRNTELLIWIDLFTGYVAAKASASRTAQTAAENYEEYVFRGFGASETIRHDREPGFMSDFFRSFNKIVGQRQRATMAYRPQANGTTERMVGTLTRAIKMYVEDVDQRDWDEYAERLTFALNTAQDRRTKNDLSEDFQKEFGLDIDDIEYKPLQSLDNILCVNGKTLENYGLTVLQDYELEVAGDEQVTGDLIQQELNAYPLEQLEPSAEMVTRLNANQQDIFDQVISAIETPEMGLEGAIVVAVASNGITATLLTICRTAHSMFRILLKPNEHSACCISKQSQKATLIRQARLIIWDEAPMMHRSCFEAVDRTFRDIMDNDTEPFGGKVIVFSGDHRQIPPVLKNTTRAETVKACFKVSPLWGHLRQVHLTENMRVKTAPDPDGAAELAEFSDFLLQIGEGQFPSNPDIGEGDICIPRDTGLVRNRQVPTSDDD